MKKSDCNKITIKKTKTQLNKEQKKTWQPRKKNSTIQKNKKINEYYNILKLKPANLYIFTH